MGNADLPSPFGQLRVDLSDSELRETAYEILVAACRSTGAKPLAYVAHSERPLPLLLTSTAASTMKKALGFGPSSSKKSKKKSGAGKEGTPSKHAKKPATVEELMRVQMRVSEQADSRIRKGLTLIAAGQSGRRIESMVLPLELLQKLKASDFSEQQEYEAWKGRNLKMLEAGLLVHTFLPLDDSDTASERLRKIIHGTSIETGKNSESMKVLRDAVVSLACTSPDGSDSDFCHWADGFPLNLHLYQMLLEACFDGNGEESINDSVLEWIKNSWVVLGINQMLHNLCFSWVLFHHFVTTGETHIDLLLAADNLMAQVAKDAKEANDPDYSKILNSALTSLLQLTEQRLAAYHDNFNASNTDYFESIISLGVLAAIILAGDTYVDSDEEEEADVARDKIDMYIRSSLRTAFAKRIEQVELAESNRQSSMEHTAVPLLSVLAKDVDELARTEKETFSPILKKWQPLAAGIAVVTLHSCYGNELTKFISEATEPTPDTIKILEDADKLEKYLVCIAVEASVDSEDGGKSLIQEMPPYDAESAIVNLVNEWIKTRVERLGDWIDRNIQQENWNPRANKENCAPSAIEVLLLINETLDAYFQLPIQMHRPLIPDLLIGLDRSLQHYALNVKSRCGTRSNYAPPLPPLTRCKGSSKLWKKRDKPHSLPHALPKRTVSTNDDSSLGLLQLCVRINSLHYLETKLETVEKRIKACLRNLESAQADILDGLQVRFEHTLAACHEGVLHLYETTAYKVIFEDFSHVLWDGLYVGDTASSRIDPFLKELDFALETISDSVNEKLRDCVIAALMKASFEGFLLVLLAGGPVRLFSHNDLVIAEDFRSLMDMYLADGNGLPSELVEEAASQLNDVLPLFHKDSGSLIVLFNQLMAEQYGDAAKSKHLMPPTTGNWSSKDPNTILRVLCHRNDDIATKFLKRTYHLPKRISASKVLASHAD